MKKSFLLTLLLLGNTLMAKNNVTDSNSSTEHNTTLSQETNSTKSKQVEKLSKESITQQQVKEQMEREKKYAKEQVFYQGDDYDLSAHEVNQNSLADVPLIETDLDFDMDDVYRDDL